jgi:hypothetical protein
MLAERLRRMKAMLAEEASNLAVAGRPPERDGRSTTWFDDLRLRARRPSRRSSS